MSAGRFSVWVNEDLMGALRTSAEWGKSEVAAGLRERLAWARDCCRCGRSGFVWDGWTRLDLSREEVRILKALRPSSFKREDS